MAVEAREPPYRPGARLYRLVLGRAGWKSLVIQLACLALLIWLVRDVVINAQDNLRAQNISSGFGFLWNSAGFAVNQSLISYSESDTYLRVFVVGILNTLLVSVIGIVLATIIGFAVALGRLSSNWLVSRLCTAYVEVIRNLPLLFQLLFWYLAVLAALPSPRQSLSVFGLGYLNNRGFVVPHPLLQNNWNVFAVAIVVALCASLAMGYYARRRLFATGEKLRIWPFVLALFIGLPALSIVMFGTPVHWEMPQLRGFNFVGGVRIIPELVALTVALSTYTASFISETVRSGILAIHKGQTEAGASLGLSRGEVLRLIVVPQAVRVILPPLTNQYLNLTKNSSLAVAIGYPDLFSVFAGSTLSQTGQAVEIIAMTMGVYLLLSLFTSAAMSFYSWRIERSQHA